MGGTIMFRLVLMSLFLVHSLPVEDTEEVAAAKAEFAELFAAAEAGDHAALAPVNSDVQASQIPATYIEDTAEVAAAKEAPAPVHLVASPTYAANLPLSYQGLSYSPGYSYYSSQHAPAFHNPTTSYYASAALPHLSIPAFGLRSLPYNGLPYSGLPPYNGIPSYATYAALPSLAYNTLVSA